MSTIRLFFAATLVLLLTCLSPSLQAGTGPMEQLRPALTELTRLLSDPGLKGEENKEKRRSLIMASIKEGFNFTEMCRRILGATWNSISVQEQELFTDQMTKLLENVYIGKLESYSGQSIGYVGERVRDNRAQVSTVIEDNNLQLPVHYVMALENGRWMVYDINIEGVSLVRNYMEQFRSIIRNEKFEGLLKVIEAKNRSFAAGTANG